MLQCQEGKNYIYYVVTELKEQVRCQTWKQSWGTKIC